MARLYNKGHCVIGIEGVLKPVMDLFEEHNIEYTEEKISEGSIFQSTDKRLKIFVGDFFDFTRHVCSTCFSLSLPIFIANINMLWFMTVMLLEKLTVFGIEQP